MGKLGIGVETLAQWARGAILVLLVVAMAAAGSGMLGAPVWAAVGLPNAAIHLADNEASPDNDDALPGTPGQTTVSGVACPGLSRVRVRSLTGFAIGNTIRINSGGATQEDARVVDVGCDGPFLHLADPLKSRHLIGEAVVVVGQVSSVTQAGDDSRREQAQRRTEEQRQQDQQTNQLGRDDIHTEGDVASVDFTKQPPEIVILTRDGPQTVQLLCGDQCPTIRAGDYVEVDGVKEHEGLFRAETVTVTSR